MVAKIKGVSSIRRLRLYMLVWPNQDQLDLVTISGSVCLSQHVVSGLGVFQHANQALKQVKMPETGRCLQFSLFSSFNSG